MRKKTYDDQALLEREAQQAVKELRKRILSLEVSGLQRSRQTSHHWLYQKPILIIFSMLSGDCLCSQEEKLATINKEVKRRERAEREVSILQMAKKDLESRTQVLEAQIGFYRNNPPLSSLQVRVCFNNKTRIGSPTNLLTKQFNLQTFLSP